MSQEAASARPGRCRASSRGSLGTSTHPRGHPHDHHRREADQQQVGVGGDPQARRVHAEDELADERVGAEQ